MSKMASGSLEVLEVAGAINVDLVKARQRGTGCVNTNVLCHAEDGCHQFVKGSDVALLDAVKGADMDLVAGTVNVGAEVGRLVKAQTMVNKDSFNL